MHNRADPSTNVRRPETRTIQTSENQDQSITELVIYFISMLLVVITFPISMLMCLMVIREYERAVIFRLGRLRSGGARGPGVVFLLPCIDDSIRVDLRVGSFDVPPQEILTRDSVTISVDAVVYFRVIDPLDAIIQIANPRAATELLAQTTLRNIAGTKGLVELLTEKENLSKAIEQILDEATDPWGIKVERVEIKDVRLPISLQRALAAEAEASREAKAKIVAAEGELNASRTLKEASDVMAQNPMTLQLRYLQTLNTISAEKNSTIIVPIPLDLMKLLN